MRWPSLLLAVAACACMSTASLQEFPGVGIQVHQIDSDVGADVYLDAPEGCPSLDTHTSILVNGRPPDTSGWGAILDQGECQVPRFQFSLQAGDDVELVMSGNGHVDDVIVRHGVAPRRFVMPPMPVTIAPGGSLPIGWSGAPGDAPAFEAYLVTSKTIHTVTVTPGGGGIVIGVPNKVAPGDYALELFARIEPTPSVCTGIASCSALVMVDAKFPVTVASTDRAARQRN